MNRGIQTTATGMASAQKQLDVIANNLANSSTNGFKRDIVAFNEELERQLNSAGRNIGTLSTGAVEQGEYTVFDAGPIQATHNPLDIAIPGEKGLFAVQSPQGVRYTRDGAFQLSESSEIVTKDGLPVLDEALRPITLPPGKIKVGTDGTVSVNDQPAGKIALFEGTFQKEGESLFIGLGTQPVADAEVRPEALEGSNVNPVESMIQMIGLSRNFEMAQKSIQQQDELTQRLIQSLQDR
jgi:flagellar basal body rod protein FlgG